MKRETVFYILSGEEAVSDKKFNQIVGVLQKIAIEIFTSKKYQSSGFNQDRSSVVVSGNKAGLVLTIELIDLENILIKTRIEGYDEKIFFGLIEEVDKKITRSIKGIKKASVVS